MRLKQNRDTKCIDDKEQCLIDSDYEYTICVISGDWNWDDPYCLYVLAQYNSWCEEEEAICKDIGAGEVTEECMQYCP
jgi:hypothetical protein